MSKVKGTCPNCGRQFQLDQERFLPPHAPTAANPHGVCEGSMQPVEPIPPEEPPPVVVPVNPACQALKFCPGCGAKVKHGQAHH